jgi:hypothetical protein
VPSDPVSNLTNLRRPIPIPATTKPLNNSLNHNTIRTQFITDHLVSTVEIHADEAVAVAVAEALAEEEVVVDSVSPSKRWKNLKDRFVTNLHLIVMWTLNR